MQLYSYFLRNRIHSIPVISLAYTTRKRGKERKKRKRKKELSKLKEKLRS